MCKITLLFAMLVNCCVYAQPQLVFTGFDLEPGSGNSNPSFFSTINGKLCFSATTVATGNELWATDGTTTGPQMLKDIRQGSQNSYPIGYFELNGKLFFSANDSVHGGELWETDGTLTGTQLSVDAWSGQGSNYPYEFKALLGNNMIYMATDSLHGREIWLSDGTVQGTHMIKDIRPGAQGSWPSNIPHPIVICNGQAYFVVNDGTHGIELWATDGTEQGTRMVMDIRTGKDGSDPRCMYVFDNKLFFKAVGTGYGYEWFVTDGNDTATRILKDINPGWGSSATMNLNDKMIMYKGKGYFAADDGLTGSELWVTDGTDTGTQMLVDINQGSAGSNPGRFAVYNDKLYFAAGDNANGRELWETDGTATGTKMIKDIQAGAGNSDPSSLFVYKKYMYFVAEESNGEHQLFVTDGSDTGTYNVAPPHAFKNDPFGIASYDYEFFMFDSIMYFAANYDSTGLELWSMEDTTSGYVAVREVATVNDYFSVYPNPAAGRFVVKINNATFHKGRLTIYDMSGKLVHCASVEQPVFAIDVPMLPAGMYTISIQSALATATRKIVIE